MNIRETYKAIMHYQPYDRIPVVCLGHWPETLRKWVAEGHLKQEEIEGANYCNDIEVKISKKLGFDDTILHLLGDATNGLYQLYPLFEEKVLDILPNGHQRLLTESGVIEIRSPGHWSIHATDGCLLSDRKSWEELYKPRLTFSRDRFDKSKIERLKASNQERDYPLGLFCGSMFGQVRNMLTLEGYSFMMVDDPALFEEICQTVAELNFKNVEYLLQTGITFEYAHFWEDICFNTGPLINPKYYYENIGPNYKRITELAKSYGIDIVSLDCDGKVDDLVSTWIDHGINTLFPIEVGTWDASIVPFREKYGKEIRGVGGMRKHVLAQDRKAIKTEVDRLRGLVEMGGFIPCPDHHLPPDAEWDLILYYTDLMHQVFE